MKNEVLIGPNLEQTMITAGLDFYKPTMSQLAYEKQQNTEVTFTFKNRGSQNLLEYVDPEVIGSRLDQIRQNGFSEEEINYLGELRNTANEPMFSENFLNSLSENELPKVNIELKDNDLAFSTTGEWSMVTFWETVLMSEVNEIYFENYIKANGIDVMALYHEGERRLNEKINILRDNPDIKFSDFGTRRHFSLRWQKYVVERLKNECPDNFLGTSNVALSQRIGTKPVGTFAHEMPMVYAGMADANGEDIKKSHSSFLNDWYEQYGNDLSVALTDTFGTKFFFSDFTKEQAEKWRSLRQDSGDPIEFGEKTIEFYQQNDVNLKKKQ
jgi:nicotinate phosphoribosyltransferase